jgi:hypothetical protein
MLIEMPLAVRMHFVLVDIGHRKLEGYTTVGREVVTLSPVFTSIHGDLLPWPVYR